MKKVCRFSSGSADSGSGHLAMTPAASCLLVWTLSSLLWPLCLGFNRADSTRFSPVHARPVCASPMLEKTHAKESHSVLLSLQKQCLNKKVDKQNGHSDIEQDHHDDQDRAVGRVAFSPRHAEVQVGCDGRGFERR